MNSSRIMCLAIFSFLLIASPSISQKKYDKIVKKANSAFAAGKYESAKKSLSKLKKGTAKLGPNNPYMPGYYLMSAKVDLGQGLMVTFESNLNNALSSSMAAYTENSAQYASTLIDVANVYNQYGYYRISRKYADQAEDILEHAGLMNDEFKGRLALERGEALIGQGYCNEAIKTLVEVEPYFVKRAVEKETVVTQGKIETKRVDETELPFRFGDRARQLTLIAQAYGKKGNLISADSAFKAAQTWIKKNQRYMGETSLNLVRNNFQYAKMFFDNGGKAAEKELELDEILKNLKARTQTDLMIHDIYDLYLGRLQSDGYDARYQNVKLEYVKLLDKSYPKTTLFKLNLQSVEFSTKLAKDKTKNLEAQALAMLGSKVLPKYYRTTISVLDFLREVAIADLKFINAENYLTQKLEVVKELAGENSPEYHLAKLELASYLLDYTNKIDEADKIFQESYSKIVAKEIDNWQKDHLNILGHLANLYEYTDRYALADKTLSKAGDVARSKYSDTDPDYGVALTQISNLQLKIGQYEKAEHNIDNALKILDEYRKDDFRFIDYVHIVETQAKLYGIKGLFDEAQSNLDRTAKIISKAKVPAGDELSTAAELSSLFIQLGKYSETDKILTKLIKQNETLYGVASIRLIEPLVNKGRILLAKGEYTEAERVAQRANSLAVKTYGEISTKTAPTQKLMSDIYYTLGDYEKAEASVVKTITSQEKQFGRNHIEVAKSLSQLALIKFYKGDNRQDVEKLMLEARDIMAGKLGKDNPQYAEILKNVAVLYVSEKKFDVAFNSLTVAESIWRAKTGSKNNINAAGIYVLTGDIYYQQKNYKNAEKFYNQAKDIYEKFFSTTHPEYVKVLSKLAKVYYMEKDYKRSKKLIEESLFNYENFIKQYFPALSEREKAKYWNTIKGDFEFYNTLAFSNLEDFKDLTSKVYNYQLLTKALLLSSSIKIRERIQNSTDEALKSQYNTWQQKKEQLTLALSMSPQQLTENEIDVAALNQEVEKLEKDLSQKSEIFGQSFENKRITFDDVRKSLKPNEVAIEMVRYRHFNHVFTDSVVYTALYLRSDLTKPKAIMLNNGKKMEARNFRLYRNAIINKIPDEVSYAAYWEPMQKELGQVATIYLSADGVYNQINLESIPTPDGKYILDNSNIILVSNTKDLYIKKVKTRLSSNENMASMFGNPAFYLTASADGDITALPGTEKEVTQLQYLLKQKGWSINQFVDRNASEEHVKELNSPRIFHIATHGFYKPTDQLSHDEELEGNEAQVAQNPLLRNGLLLKGAGDLLLKTQYNYNMENGILTAYEAMNLNLDKTDLVVLSACETGLGELQAGEGVFGLQRAFLVAGAKVLIMSMFKVDDDA
ncbi:MAG: CHAT domain-containing protein, partial [Flammeovirgaceae bacterium]|nr:CHAT domain-containing protein [Flammeovirgaceae bacterium]